jgi:hypothetical protein
MKTRSRILVLVSILALVCSSRVTTQGQSHPLSGQSTYGSGLLTLVQAEGGPPMVGRVTWRDADHFVFQALGGGPGDPGLSFSRSS